MDWIVDRDPEIIGVNRYMWMSTATIVEQGACPWSLVPTVAELRSVKFGLLGWHGHYLSIPEVCTLFLICSWWI